MNTYVRTGPRTGSATPTSAPEGGADPATAALHRLAADMRAEAAELPREGWLRRRLQTDVAIDGWGDLVLPELAALMRAAEPATQRWVRVRAEPAALLEAEEAALRRLGALLRAEAAELEDDEPALARRLDGWGIRLQLECERPQRDPERMARGGRS